MLAIKTERAERMRGELSTDGRQALHWEYQDQP